MLFFYTFLKQKILNRIIFNVVFLLGIIILNLGDNTVVQSICIVIVRKQLDNFTIIKGEINMYNLYVDNGVVIKPNVIAKGDDATVIYNGLLCNSGADTVYLHAGYGNSWDNTKDIKMTKTYDGFEAKVPVTSQQQLNMAFKDSANNWDNNNTNNYTFEVQER